MLHANPPPSPNLWLLRLLTLLLAALATASLAFWVLHWPAGTPTSQSPSAVARPATADSAKIATLLGASLAAEKPPVVSTSSAYKLMGVIAEGGIGQQGARGSALISVEGALAKPYRVGDEIADGLVLQSVHARSAVLGRAGQSGNGLTLELPQLPGMPDTP